MQSDAPRYRCVWAVDSRDELSRLRALGLECVLRKSAAGIWTVAAADVVVHTHGLVCPPWLTRPFVVNLWHGTSPKGMGFSRKSSTVGELRGKTAFGGRVDLTTSTSINISNMISASHAIPANRIEVTGAPRNDWVLGACGQAFDRLLPGELRGRGVVLYVPTTRRERPGRPASTEHSPSAWCESIEMRAMLERRNAVLVTKPHPYDEGNSGVPHATPDVGPLRTLVTADLEAERLDLYEVLGSVDVLVTDYSSVYFDFLLLDRPIVFLHEDMQEYAARRGLKVEPVDIWFPGAIATSAAQCVEAVERALAKPSDFANERRFARKLVHRYCDAESSARVWRHVNLALGEVT